MSARGWFVACAFACAGCSPRIGSTLDAGGALPDGGGRAGYLDGTGLGLVDCATSPSEARCVKPTSASAGSVGQGPRLDSSTIGFGFVDADAKRLIVAVEAGTQFDDDGGIFAIDLATGARTLLSGKIEDARTGAVTRGAGPDLGGVASVGPTPDKRAFVAYANTGSDHDRRLLRIDPTNGDRTLIWQGRSVACDGASLKLIPPYFGMSLAVGEDGGIYLPINDNPPGAGWGVVRFVGATCQVVSISGAASAADNRGGGITTIHAEYRALQFAGGKVYALDFLSQSLIAIDPDTGTRTRVSSSSDVSRVGAGEAGVGTEAFAVVGDAFWTTECGGQGELKLSSIDRATGDRTGYSVSANPVTLPPACASLPGVWEYPNHAALVISVLSAFVVFDPSTGNANLLSY